MSPQGFNSVKMIFQEVISSTVSKNHKDDSSVILPPSESHFTPNYEDFVK